MQNYENLIMEFLDGDTPKQKYEFIVNLIKAVDDIAYYRIGTTKKIEYWEIIEKLQSIVKHKYIVNIEYPKEISSK